MRNYFFIPFILFLLVSENMDAQTKLKNALQDDVVVENTPVLKAAYEQKGLTWANPVYLRIFKQDGINEYGHLQVWIKDTKTNTYVHFRNYPICFFHGGAGPKYSEGDGRTPEGFYGFGADAINQYSSLFRSFNIGFPNAYDRAQGYTGSFIMIHGECVAIGCLAMTNSYMAEIWTIAITALGNGQREIPVHIFPFELTQDNLKNETATTYYGFWQELQPAYLYFEQQKQVPRITVKNKKYVVN